jgi:hypothetical protein
MSSNTTFWKKGVKDGIPIALGYFAVSFTFGIVAKNAGLTRFQAVFMSATNLTSAGQFGALSLIGTLGSLYRNGAYSIDHQFKILSDVMFIVAKAKCRLVLSAPFFGCLWRHG